ncbi:RNA polymerase sigma factor [Myxococcota bacterium]|nr:RNA polymerase sigma factor [Myxococcota bacterium]
MNEPLDDLALFDAWRAGDRGAGATLIERHYDTVVRFFRTKAGPYADDLVQRTFLAVAEGAERYRGASSFRAFLFGVARNVFFEFLRARTKDRLVAPDFAVSSLADLDTGIVTKMGRRDQEQLLVRCLQTLPVELQVAVELYYWEELSIAELAEVQGVPPGTVKSRLSRARALLAEAMAREEATADERSSMSSVIATWRPVDDAAV